MLTNEELRERQAFRERYEELTAGDGSPRSLTREEAIAYLTYEGEDGWLGTPACHWGRTSADCAPVAYGVALVFEAANGDIIGPDSLDSCMSMVVNDGDGVNDLLLELTPEDRDELGIEVDSFTESLSSGHYSTDTQAVDAMSWLRDQYPGHYASVVAQFPAFEAWTFGEGVSSWFDTEAMGVDEEWGSWLVDAIEATGVVCWQDGEPWGNPRGEDA